MIKPYITEKAMIKANDGKYTFIIDKNFNKKIIATEINKIFKVDVAKVAIINRKGKVTVFKRKLGRRNDSKIAIVTLKKGQKINEFVVEEPKKEEKSKSKVKNDKE